MEGYVQIILQHQFAQNHKITTKKLQKHSTASHLRGNEAKWTLTLYLFYLLVREEVWRCACYLRSKTRKAFVQGLTYYPVNNVNNLLVFSRIQYG